jgi:hypothetical protein
MTQRQIDAGILAALPKGGPPRHVQDIKGLYGWVRGDVIGFRLTALVANGAIKRVARGVYVRV